MNNFRITIKEEKSLFTKGSQWRHRNGKKYTLVGIANTEHISLNYPIMVLYIGRNGDLWAKTLSNFMEKMTPLEHLKNKN